MVLSCKHQELRIRYQSLGTACIFKVGLECSGARVVTNKATCEGADIAAMRRTDNDSFRVGCRQEVTRIGIARTNVEARSGEF
jgi:hypothetical protein